MLQEHRSGLAVVLNNALQAKHKKSESNVYWVEFPANTRCQGRMHRKLLVSRLGAHFSFESFDENLDLTAE